LTDVCDNLLGRAELPGLAHGSDFCTFRRYRQSWPYHTDLLFLLA
jgi:hypothetical protein